MKKKTIYYWIICLLFLGLSSCNKDDDQSVFADSPADRIANRNSELNNLLLSQSQGYKAVYFTKNDEFGGFTYYMNFKANGTVTMTSDFNAETDLRTSDYEVRLGTTTELVFTTRNHIQKPSETSGLNTDGFRGTSVFQYFSNDNGVITFKDVRNDSTSSLVLTPTGFSNFESESVPAAKASLAQRQNILPAPTASVFQILRIENSNGVSNFNLNYDRRDLYAMPRITFDDGTVEEFEFGMAFTSDGLILSPALEYEGQSYTDFIYDEATSSYVSSVDGTTATILFGDEPAYLGRDTEELPQRGPTGFAYNPGGFGDNSLTSDGFDLMIAAVNANLASSYGLRFTQFQLTLDFESDDCETTLYIAVNDGNGGSYGAFYCFEKAVIKDRKLFLRYLGPSGGNAGLFENELLPIIGFFNSSQGMIYTKEGGFKSNIANYSNSSSTFTSGDEPSLRVYGLWFG